MDAIVVEDLTVRFGGKVAVDNISFTVQAGEVVGLLGGNGAGKSTTLKTVVGVVKPTAGNVMLKGLNMSNRKLAEVAKAFTGYGPDEGGLILGATPRQHIQLLLNLHRSKKPYGVALDMMSRVGLGDYLDTQVGNLSKGEKRRLSALLAALSAEEILILDEPFDGLDPLGNDAIASLVFEAADAGLAVMVSTHMQELLVRVSDRVLVMNHGNILAVKGAGWLEGKRGARRYERLLLQ